MTRISCVFLNPNFCLFFGTNKPSQNPKRVVQILCRKPQNFYILSFFTFCPVLVGRCLLSRRQAVSNLAHLLELALDIRSSFRGSGHTRSGSEIRAPASTEERTGNCRVPLLLIRLGLRGFESSGRWRKKARRMLFEVDITLQSVRAKTSRLLLSSMTLLERTFLSLLPLLGFI